MKKIKLWWYKLQLSKIEDDMTIFQCYSYDEYVSKINYYDQKILDLLQD